MTRLIARIRISSACVILALLAVPARGADSMQPTMPLADAAAPTAAPAVPTDEPAVSSTEPAMPSVESVLPGKAEPSPADDASASPDSAQPDQQPAGQPMQQSLGCEPGGGGGWTFHPLAAWRANFAANHNAPVYFPRYDGQTRAVVVPGARVAAYLTSQAGFVESEPPQAGPQQIEQPGSQSAEPGVVNGIEPTDGSSGLAPAGECCMERSVRWFGGSDYYLIRPHQTYDTAYELSPNGATGPEVTNVNFNPSFGNAVRLFAGFETSCDESLRFSYTYMFNDTQRSDAVPAGASILTPLGATLFPGDSLIATDHLLLNAWDLEDVRKVNLASCGCRDCCPSWDVNWSWGARVLQIDESILDGVSGPDAGPFSQKSSYIGAGPRLGIDVHRHFGHSAFSAYVSSDAALLVGEAKTYGPTTPSGTKGVQAVPNFDLQLGLAWQPTCHLSVTGGYLFEIFGNATQLSESSGLALLAPPQVSDLSYDGFFFRGEFKY